MVKFNADPCPRAGLHQIANIVILDIEEIRGFHVNGEGAVAVLQAHI